MKVVFLTASTSRKAGGLYFTITEFTKSLLAKDIDVSVIGLDDEDSLKDRIGYGKVPVIPYKCVNIPVLKTFGYSNELCNILECVSPDIIHLQGIWMYHSWVALKYKQKHSDTVIIIEPHGMLDPWAVKNSAWKKKIVGHLFEYKNLRTADCIHALCQSEKESIRAFGLKNRVEIIPNGIDIKNTLEAENKKNIIQYIGRIHPKKGIDLIIDAVKLIHDTNSQLISQWKIRIAGWDQNNYQKELENKVHKYGIEKYIEFSGPRFGMDKEKDLIESKAFILPSYSEGLPMSILEAWSYGLPVIMTEYCNLPEGFSSGAAIKVDTNAMSVAKGLNSIMTASADELKIMGTNARELVSNSFTWSKIAEDTIKMYKSLIKY